MSWKSVDEIAAFDAFRFIEMIAPRPLLMVVGTEAVTKHMTTDAFAAAREPKQLHWVEAASHVDLYDRKAYVPDVVANLDEFFHAALVEAVAA